MRLWRTIVQGNTEKEFCNNANHRWCHIFFREFCSSTHISEQTISQFHLYSWFEHMKKLFVEIEITLLLLLSLLLFWIMGMWMEKKTCVFLWKYNHECFCISWTIDVLLSLTLTSPRGVLPTMELAVIQLALFYKESCWCPRIFIDVFEFNCVEGAMVSLREEDLLVKKTREIKIIFRKVFLRYNCCECSLLFHYDM